MRMGHDKSVIAWHGKEQRYHVADMLGGLCEQVFISCREEQAGEIDTAYPTITDSHEGSGPIVAILSAFKKYSEVAWLVVACDLPLLDVETLSYLVENRHTSGIATTFSSPFDELPEPLITIWEPDSYPVLLSHIADGYKCPRKALIRNEQRVRVLNAPQADALLNANTPGDAEKVKTLMSDGK